MLSQKLVSRRTLGVNLQICTGCIKSEGGNLANGCIMACPVSKRQAAEHYTTGECPKSLLKTHSLPPPEDIPEGFDLEREKRRLKSGGCCGSPSKE